MQFLVRFCTKMVSISLLFGLSTAFALELRPDQQHSAEGYYTLRWDDSSQNISTLEMSPSADFHSVETRYDVSDMTQISITGYTDGQYFFRLVDEQGNRLSNNVSVTVKHRSLSQALQLFGIGSVLFLILVSVLLFGPRQAN